MRFAILLVIFLLGFLIYRAHPIDRLHEGPGVWSGDTAALMREATSWETGEGHRAPDPARAVDYLQRAAARGHRGAMARLAWHYQHGSGVSSDAATAGYWYSKAGTREADAGRGMAERAMDKAWKTVESD